MRTEKLARKLASVILEALDGYEDLGDYRDVRRHSRYAKATPQLALLDIVKELKSKGETDLANKLKAVHSEYDVLIRKMKTK